MITRTLIYFFTIVFVSATACGQSWQWGRGSIGSNFDASAVATDQYGNVFVAGINITQTIGLTPSVVVGTDTIPCEGEAYQVVMVKYNGKGDFQWATATHSPEGQCLLLGLATDNFGNAILFGSFSGSYIVVGGDTLRNKINLLETQYFLAKFDQNGTLIWAKNDGNTLPIPPLDFFLYGNGLLRTGGVCTDSLGDIFITTSFHYPNIVIGAYHLSNIDVTGNTDDIFVAKYDPSGNVIWANRLGGNGSDDAVAITATPAGDIYIAGIFGSSAMPVGSVTISNTAPQRVTFIARLDYAGNPQWGCSSGGTGLEYASGLSADQNNNVYMIGGMTESAVSFSGTTIANPYAGSVLYLVKFDQFNNVSWSKTIGAWGSQVWGWDVCSSICGEIWISGVLKNSAVIDGNAITAPIGATEPVFIAGFTSGGTFTHHYGILSSGGDDQSGLACDRFGNVFFCNDYEDTPFIIGADTLANISLSNAEEWMYIGKFGVQSDTTFKSFDTTVCLPSKVTIKADAGYTAYLWNTDSTSQSITVKDTGRFWVVGFGICSTVFSIDTFRVSSRVGDFSFFLGNDTTACAPIVLQVPQNGSQYYWQDSSVGTSYTVSHSGIYYVTANQKGCSFSDTIQVKIPDLAQNFRDTVLCRELPINLDMQANVPSDGNVKWSTGESTPNIVIKDTGVYSVKVVADNCFIDDSFKVSSEYCDCSVAIPNAFTPNGDGKNDMYAPIMKHDCPIHSYAFSIFNRWGQRVFFSKDPASKWDGQFEGVKAELGTYMYYLKINAGVKHIDYMYKGDVTLIR